MKTIELAKTNQEMKRIVKRLNKIDELIRNENDKENNIEITPKYWNGFFTGYGVSPTARCVQLTKGIEKRTSKLENEQFDLFQKITINQASKFGYCTDGMEEADFKTSD